MPTAWNLANLKIITYQSRHQPTRMILWDGVNSYELEPKTTRNILTWSKIWNMSPNEAAQRILDINTGKINAD